MSFPLSYCRNGFERIERLRCLYETRPPNRIFAVIQTPSQVLESFAQQYAEGYTSQPDPADRADFWDRLLSERMAVDDDSIPCAYLSELDQGLYGGICGGKIQYMAHPDNGWISSMVPPLIEDWSGFERLSVDRESEAYGYYRRLITTLVARAEGRFGISHFILIDGLNFLFELFGATRAYMEVAENPDRVRQAIDFAYRLNLDVQTTFFEHVPLVAGGTCSNMAGWIPGRIVSESVDPFHMTSVGYFEQWGREPASRILRSFDGGVLHIHGNGRHLIEAVSSLPGLKAILLNDDRGYPSAFSILPQLKPRTGGVPVVVHAGFEEFREALERHALTGGVLYKVKEAPDVDSANRLMDAVREYRV